MRKIVTVLTLVAMGIAGYLFLHVSMWTYSSPAYTGTGISFTRIFAALQFGILAAYLPFIPIIPLYICTKKSS
jgi:hypothetical protein